MAKIRFLPAGSTVDAAEGDKLLALAIRSKIPIRYGCASCRCGTCAVRVSEAQSFTPMSEHENELLTRIGLNTDGTVRLSCQARVKGDSDIDLGFQATYSPAPSED